ncbi:MULTISPECIES: hypothetical protein [Aestuariibaculum]|uniref:Uncharacterized protein n=1 Tax=Aestuariibaculum marinum TaxID=2683592 RepID=A0A8J6PU12_9FLAO|nr:MULTISPECIES: hypothetical protein [Aestuariibaculum]MBD0823328.1 hypothetical protein [Aestuariibaculum marinum]WMI66664.1 hypothetical protein RBH94_05740 [Aestuariibaculum sp. YM273]
MKNLLFILAFVFVSFSAFSQDRSDLKGPAYKNYKPWKHKTEAKPVFTSNTKTDLKGPEYKNRKVWKKSEEASYTQVVVENKKANLMGPAYKNYKPNKEKEVSIVAANE